MPLWLVDLHFRQMTSRLPIQRLKIVIIRFRKRYRFLMLRRILFQKCCKEIQDIERQLKKSSMISSLHLFHFQKLCQCLLWLVHQMLTFWSNIKYQLRQKDQESLALVMWEKSSQLMMDWELIEIWSEMSQKKS